MEGKGRGPALKGSDRPESRPTVTISVELSCLFRHPSQITSVLGLIRAQFQTNSSSGYSLIIFCESEDFLLLRLQQFWLSLHPHSSVFHALLRCEVVNQTYAEGFARLNNADVFVKVSVMRWPGSTA